MESINLDPTHWFALTDREAIIPLGIHKNFNDASDVADELPDDVVWIFTKESMKQLEASVKNALENL